MCRGPSGLVDATGALDGRPPGPLWLPAGRRFRARPRAPGPAPVPSAAAGSWPGAGSERGRGLLARRRFPKRAERAPGPAPVPSAAAGSRPGAGSERGEAVHPAGRPPSRPARQRARHGTGLSLGEGTLREWGRRCNERLTGREDRSTVRSFSRWARGLAGARGGDGAGARGGDGRRSGGATAGALGGRQALGGRARRAPRGTERAGAAPAGPSVPGPPPRDHPRRADAHRKTASDARPRPTHAAAFRPCRSRRRRRSPDRGAAPRRARPSAPGPSPDPGRIVPGIGRGTPPRPHGWCAAPMRAPSAGR